MVAISGHSEYGNPLNYMFYMFFDIMKKQILKVEKITLTLVFRSSEQCIGLKTIPIRN
jgi:hypothetical protein